MDRNRNSRMYWVLAAAVLLLTQIMASSQFLSVDNVNLAFSLEYFDPLNHQPQPPGYPLFVLFARGVNYLVGFIGSVEHTFMLISILTAALCLPVMVALGRRLFASWPAKAAVLLLVVNPVFWQTAATSPLRPFLALFSLLSAYCAWRCWNGDRRYLYWGALCLGVGSGFRPELLLFLFPLWVVSAWAGRHSVKAIAVGTSIVAAVVMIWVGALVVAVGGVQSLVKLFSDYAVVQSQAGSVLLGASFRGWMRQLSRIVAWNGTAIFWWVWAVPFLFRRWREWLFTREALFIALWVGPGLLLQALVHADAPGHTLFSIPVFCMLGAHVMFAKEFSPSDSNSFQMREAWFSGALVVSVMLFLNLFPMPSTDAVPGTRPSVTNAIAAAVNEASLGSIRSMDNTAAETLLELRRYTPSGRPSIVVSTDLAKRTWFFNWRILRYYEPQRDIWVLNDQAAVRTALKVRRFSSLQSISADATPISVPNGARLLWIIEPGSALEAELRETLPVSGGRYVLYIDLPKDASPFAVAGFEFKPHQGS
jgi:hypothetical protein